MIKIHRDNRVIFWLLIGGLVMNILWSLRLELQAETTKNIAAEWVLNVNKKIDTIRGLKEFDRSAENIFLRTNDRKTSIQLNQYLNFLALLGGKGTIQLGKTGDSPDSIFLAHGDPPKVVQVIFRSDLIRHEFLGQQFHIEMDRNKEFAEIRHQDSIFRVGKTPQGEGIAMGEKDSGSLVIRKDKGIAMTTGVAQIRLDRPGKGGDLSIWADGNINIRSKNGVVRINGKKIHLNKEDL